MVEYQAFRLESAPGSRIINIELSTDSVTNENFIFWEDINTFFPRLQYVHRDNVMVVYMRDQSGQRYRPKRIKHYPGSVLQVSQTPLHQANGLIDICLPPEYSASSAPPASLTDPTPAGENITQETIVEEKRIWIPPPPPTAMSSSTRLRCPRLFLVLPEEDRPLTAQDPFNNHFTLHFLCDGGKELKQKVMGCNKPNTIPGHVHLCGHQGYELDRPTEFFDRFGPYLLNLMQMLQHGFPVHGQVVHSLEELDYPRLAREGRDGFEYFPRVHNIEQSILQMIQYLKTVKMNNDHKRTFEDHVRTVELDSIVGQTNFSEVRSFLKNMSETEKKNDDLIGYLSRGYLEGSQKEVWLCSSHYDVVYDTKAARDLSQVVSANKGSYEYADKKLNLVVKASKSASLIYYSQAIAKIKNAQELDLTVDCDTSNEDLEALGHNLVEMTLRKLILNLGNHTGPAIELFNRSKRMDPIVHVLLTNRQLEVVHLAQVEGFFSKSSPFRELKPTSLQEIHLDSLFDPKAHVEKLIILIKQSPLLKTLSLTCAKAGFCETIELVKEIITSHTYFQYLNVSCPVIRATFDRAEPGSCLLDPVAPPSSATETMVLSRYWRDLEAIIFDDSYKNEHVALTARLLHEQETKLKKFIISRNERICAFEDITEAGFTSLTAVAKELSGLSKKNALMAAEPSTTRPEKEPFLLDQKQETSVEEPLLSPLSEESSYSTSYPAPSSSRQDTLQSMNVNPLCEVTLRVRYPYDHHKTFVPRVFPYLTKIELIPARINDFLPQLHNTLDLDQPSLAREFRLESSYSYLKDATITILVQIIKLCPLLETLRLSRIRMKTPEWERFLGCLDYSRLKVLHFDRCNICQRFRRFPTSALPTNAVLRELALTKTYIHDEVRRELADSMARLLPACRVVLVSVPHPKSLLDNF
ncbi:hypothetical protein BGZ83_007704 [Gryganskiella cystojenkinii]|nr:hypothetical protein BGZ83_007704 [Gryganskiella cystojenkinii]